MLSKHYPLSYLQFFQIVESEPSLGCSPLKAYYRPVYHHCLLQVKLHVLTFSPLRSLLRASTSGWP